MFSLVIMDKKARNFRNYKVWQDAVDYASKVYTTSTCCG